MLCAHSATCYPVEHWSRSVVLYNNTIVVTQNNTPAGRAGTAATRFPSRSGEQLSRPARTVWLGSMYGRILVPTDGSAGMERVIRHAADLARVHGAELHLLYVVNTASFANLPMETSWEGVSEMLHEEGETALDEAERAAGDVPTERVTLEGTPSREIVRYARREGCDLVCMGTHGRGGLNRLLLGSVAERVVRSSEVPVLTVRVGERPDELPPGDPSERDGAGGDGR